MQDIPQYILKASPQYKINKYGVLQDSDGNIVKTHNGAVGPMNGRYSIIIHNKKTLYIHRIMFFTFNPHLNPNDGRVILKPNLTKDIINLDGKYRNYLEDFMFQPKNKIIHQHYSKKLVNILFMANTHVIFDTPLLYIFLIRKARKI